MNITEEGLRIIRESEAFEPDAYYCPAGKLTIGYGHTGPDVKLGDTVSEEVAERLLLQDVAEAERIVKKHVRVALNRNQFSALVSFVFNVGPGQVYVKDGFVVLKDGRPSSMLRLLNAGDYIMAAQEFPKWVHGAGRRLPGLVTRREKERKLFLKPVQVK